MAWLFTRDVNLIILGAILGLLLTFTYDRLKDWTQRRDDRRSALGMVLRDLNANLAALSSNEEILKKDAAAQQEKKQVVVPLVPLTDAAWGIVSSGRSLSDQDYIQLAVVADAYASIRRFNHQAVSREDYRLNNEPMSNFNSRMEMLDNLLLEDGQRLRQELVASTAALQKELGIR